MKMKIQIPNQLKVKDSENDKNSTQSEDEFDDESNSDVGETVNDADLEYIDEEAEYDVMEEEDVNEVQDLKVLRCATHTLQLAVIDTEIEKSIKEISTIGEVFEKAKSNH